MIVRRITAGAAGLALIGTAFAAAPAMAKYSPLANTERPGVSSSVLTISETMGNSIAATACSDMKQELIAPKR